MNVLIVEDENTKYNEIIATLKSMCINNIERACNAKEALSLMRIINFDLVLIDMTLPFADDNRQLNTIAGKELLFDMLTEEVEIPSIVVTRYSNFGPTRKPLCQEECALTYLFNENFGLDFEERYYLNTRQFDITTFSGMHCYLKNNIPFYAGIVFFTQQNNLWRDNLIRIMEKIKK